MLHEIIANLAPQGDTWLLFDADWLFTQQSAANRQYLHLVVPIGRLRWIAGSDHDAQDSCAWYFFGPNPPPAPVVAPYAPRVVRGCG